MFRIGLVDDEVYIRDILTSYLEKENYEVISFSTAECALGYTESVIDLWIVDIMLPGMSGYDLVDSIKQENEELPIIYISARDQDFDKILGLERGGDDYLAKPFSPKELVLRVEKLLKRTYKSKGTLRKLGGYMIHENNRQILKGNFVIELTTKEFNLILLLSQYPNQAFTRDQILNHVWEPNYFGGDRVVDDLMRRLRKKLPELEIETIYGYGYRLNV